MVNSDHAVTASSEKMADIVVTVRPAVTDDTVVTVRCAVMDDIVVTVRCAPIVEIVVNSVTAVGFQVPAAVNDLEVRSDLDLQETVAAVRLCSGHPKLSAPSPASQSPCFRCNFPGGSTAGCRGSFLRSPCCSPAQSTGTGYCYLHTCSGVSCYRPHCKKHPGGSVLGVMLCLAQKSLDLLCLVFFSCSFWLKVEIKHPQLTNQQPLSKTISQYVYIVTFRVI